MNINASNDKYPATWEDYLKSKGQTESEALAEFTALIASVSSLTGSKLSLRSSAVNTPLDQAPSTNLATNLSPSNTNNLPSEGSLDTKTSISNNLIQANVHKNTDIIQTLDEHTLPLSKGNFGYDIKR